MEGLPLSSRFVFVVEPGAWVVSRRVELVFNVDRGLKERPSYLRFHKVIDPVCLLRRVDVRAVELRADSVMASTRVHVSFHNSRWDRANLRSHLIDLVFVLIAEVLFTRFVQVGRVAHEF